MKSIPSRSTRERWWPVVVFVILIAITIAAYFLYQILFPPLVFVPVATEELSFTYFAWGRNNAYCNMTVLNTSPDSVPDLSIAQVQVDGKSVTPNTPALPHTLPKGQQLTIKVTSMFMSGRQYEFSVITSWGNRFTYALQTAP